MDDKSVQEIPNIKMLNKYAISKSKDNTDGLSQRRLHSRVSEYRNNKQWKCLGETEKTGEGTVRWPTLIDDNGGDDSEDPSLLFSFCKVAPSLNRKLIHILQKSFRFINCISIFSSLKPLNTLPHSFLPWSWDRVQLNPILLPAEESGFRFRNAFP